jgi:hypothetical protein
VKWVVAATALLGGTGCLLPQEEAVLPVVLPRRNSPPRIVGFEPSQRFTLHLGDGCKLREFKVIIDDPDVSDSLRSRWFADRDPDRNEFREGTFISPKSGEGTTRSQPALPDNAIFSLPTLTRTGNHTLEVVIADGEFFGGTGLIQTNDAVRKRQVVLPDGTQVEDESYSDSFTWVLTTDLSPCQ